MEKLNPATAAPSGKRVLCTLVPECTVSAI